MRASTHTNSRKRYTLDLNTPPLRRSHLICIYMYMCIIYIYIYLQKCYDMITSPNCLTPTSFFFYFFSIPYALGPVRYFIWILHLCLNKIVTLLRYCETYLFCIICIYNYTLAIISNNSSNNNINSNVNNNCKNYNHLLRFVIKKYENVMHKQFYAVLLGRWTHKTNKNEKKNT